MAKAAGMRSISYITIKPDLQHMDIIADIILLDLREHPTSWIGKVREHESELIESFYMTVADRKKVQIIDCFFFFAKWKLLSNTVFHRVNRLSWNYHFSR